MSGLSKGAFYFHFPSKRDLALAVLEDRQARLAEAVMARVDPAATRQHADNPVAWYEWGEEAFVEARRRDVPIFLSVGYSSCHWCHVMAPETPADLRF